MKRKKDVTTSKIESMRAKKGSNFMSESTIMQFVNDVNKGDNLTFDVTTTNGFLKELAYRIKKVDVTSLGSQLAFFFLLSLFPLLIFIITLLPYFNLDQSQILVFIHEYAPSDVAYLIETTLGEILSSRNTGLLSIGILATIWSASKGLNALTKALNLSYEKEESRSFIVERGLSIVFTIMLIVVLLIALILPVFGQQIGVLAFSFLGLEDGFLQLWTKIRWTIPPALIFLVFMLVYWIVPNIRLRLSSVWPGAVFATVGWITTSLGFSYYVNNFSNYSATYGSIGAIIVLMMWLYFSAIILILGGQINAVMKKRKEAIVAKDEI